MFPSLKRYFYKLIASYLSVFTRYYDEVIQVAPLAADSGELLEAIVSPTKSVAPSLEALSEVLKSKNGKRAAILLNGNLNYDYDIEATLTHLKHELTRLNRVVVITYNPYLKWVYSCLNYLGVRAAPIPTTFATKSAYRTLAKLTGYEIVSLKHVGCFPFHLAGIGDYLNRLLVLFPVIRWCSWCAVIVLRPIYTESARPSLSIIIPCRNERGTIEDAVKRLHDFAAPIEIVFVEGHSTDGTWEEVQRVRTHYAGSCAITAFQQSGRGKCDAVRLGFSKATGELVTVLDADLTMPPELLHRFYEAYRGGHGDFINGSRLVYPIEGEAMKFLNLLGNIFFSKALSYVLDSNLSDSLCGTKLLRRDDYQRMVRWREDFGDFDPFGDFELLFPAAQLGLGIVDIPVRYRARVYGMTNIRRFYHGIMLLRMTVIGFFKVKMGV